MSQNTAPATRLNGNAATIWLLRSPFRPLIDSKVCALNVTGRRSGRTLQLPVQYCRVPTGLVVVAGRGEAKTWWRNLRRPAAVKVLLAGQWRAGMGRVVTADDPDHFSLLTAYRSTYGVKVAATGPLVHIDLADQAPPDSTVHDPMVGRRRQWWSWLWWVTAAETVGFCVPAIVAALTVNSPTVLSLPSLLAAGAVEGAVLGAAQARVLRRALPTLPVRGWVAATSLAAVFAWLLGMSPSTFGNSLQAWPTAVIVGVAVVAGVALLLSMGVAQWLVLRRHAVAGKTWIGATAIGWLAALAVFLLIAMPLWHEGQTRLTIAIIGAVAGLAMAATFAGVTGRWAVRLQRTGGR